MFGSVPIYYVLTSCKKSSYTPLYKTVIYRTGEIRIAENLVGYSSEKGYVCGLTLYKSFKIRTSERFVEIKCREL